MGEDHRDDLVAALDSAARINAVGCCPSLPGSQGEQPVFTGIVEEFGTVTEMTARGDGRRLAITADVVMGDMAIGASVAVNGCCLTVAALGPWGFEVAVTPHTWAATRFGLYEAGNAVNMEVDILAKYVERLLVTSGRLARPEALDS